MVIAGLSSSPMPPNGSSPGSCLGSSRSRSRSLLVPEPVEGDEEKLLDESDDSDDYFILVEEGPPLSSMRLCLERSGGLCANTRERVIILSGITGTVSITGATRGIIG